MTSPHHPFSSSISSSSESSTDLVLFQAKLEEQEEEAETEKEELDNLLLRLDIEHKQWSAEKMLLQERVTDSQAATSEEELRNLDLERNLSSACTVAKSSPSARS